MALCIPMRRSLPTDEEVLAAVVSRADDGFCSYRDVVLQLRRWNEREARRGVSRTTRRGLLISRRDPDGREHLALTSEGWRVHRASAG